MIRHLTRQFGFVFLGLCVLCAANSYADMADAMKHNTAQVASAVTCHSGNQELALAASIDASLLRRMNTRSK